MRSHRWITSREAEIDAYLLTDARWLLFAYIKSEELAHDDDYWQKIAASFPAGKVVCVARALKTEKSSEPLETIVIGNGDLPEEVWCKEGWLKYRLETKKVLNPGLFLDQAHNRERLIELIQAAYSRRTLSEKDTFLNLFSYTGSFTIAAICAGVKHTVSVDVSSRYLEWEKLNYDANFGGLDVEHRLINDDARDFLARSVKRGSKFRWIVIDPPTFSRGQKKMFKVQDEMEGMLEDAFKCLSPGGAIFASTNDARWDARAFFAMATKFASERDLKLDRGKTPAEFGAAHPLKSVWLLSVESSA